MKKLFAAVSFVVLLAALTPTVASAGCSATLNCNNACSLNLTCSAPYQPWFMSCSASSQTVSCTGNTSCNVESNYVQCDGRKYYCTSNQ